MKKTTDLYCKLLKGKEFWLRGDLFSTSALIPCKLLILRCATLAQMAEKANPSYIFPTHWFALCHVVPALSSPILYMLTKTWRFTQIRTTLVPHESMRCMSYKGSSRGSVESERMQAQILLVLANRPIRPGVVRLRYPGRHGAAQIHAHQDRGDVPGGPQLGRAGPPHGG